MMTFDSVERILEKWQTEFKHGAFNYVDSVPRFRAVVMAHFGRMPQKAYGIYIIRQLDTKEILYIGKGGTINGQGQYKGQDLLGRLCNTRGKDQSGKEISADFWFRSLAQERGPLEVEYMLVKPPVSPGYIEAELLQSHLAEYNRLPLKNKSL